MNGRGTTPVELRRAILPTLGLLLCLAGVAPLARAGAIQDAIDAAPDGGTVSVPAGTFAETLTVDKNLTLAGVSRSASILRPAGAGQRVITVTSGHDLTLRDLMVTGGQAPGGSGGGVYLAGGTITLLGVVITNNSASYGGGICQEGSPGGVDASDSLIQANTAAIDGGGIYATAGVALTDTEVIANSAVRHGGGLHVTSGPVLTERGLFSGNLAGTGNGGGINLNNLLTITGTRFLGNSAGDSGGGVTQWNTGPAVSITEAIFQGNMAKINGGGAYIKGTLTLAGSTFTGNVVDSGGSGNTRGGGICTTSPATVTGSNFTGNQVACQGCSFTMGGGLAIILPPASTATSSVTGSTFGGNNGHFGGGIYAEEGTLTVSGCQFESNTGGYGAGLDGFTVNADNVTFRENQALSEGGGARARAFTGDHLLFEGNYAGWSGGGGLSAASATIGASRFAGNSGGKGGGLKCGWGSLTGSLNVANTLFAQNSAWVSPFQGSAVIVDEIVAELMHVTVASPTRGNGSGIYRAGTAFPLRVSNSIVANCGTGIDSGGGTVWEGYNLFFDNALDTNNVVPLGHSVAGENPLFADPVEGDYHLQASSPAIGLGADLGVALDLDGLPRLNGRFDAGAYQYQHRTYLPHVNR